MARPAPRHRLKHLYQPAIFDSARHRCMYAAPYHVELHAREVQQPGIEDAMREGTASRERAICLQVYAAATQVALSSLLCGTTATPTISHGDDQRICHIMLPHFAIAGAARGSRICRRPTLRCIAAISRLISRQASLLGRWKPESPGHCRPRWLGLHHRLRFSPLSARITYDAAEPP